MKVAGIIAEYNPFHAGHAYHIAQTRAMGATHIVAVMSGNTVQRGEFAIGRKELRARAALENGVDLAICLPAPWSCARAQDFARGAISLIKALGFIDVLSFGSECGDIGLIRRAAELTRDRGVNKTIKELAGQGRALAAARQAALREVDFAASELLRQPNDTLNVEYFNALAACGAEIAPLAIQRIGAGHDVLGFREKGPCSASELRIIMSAGEFHEALVPSGALWKDEMRRQMAPVRTRQVELAMLAKLRCMSPGEIARLPDISEGLEHRIWRAARQAGSLEELLRFAATKRYPVARIRRIVFHSFLGVTKESVSALPGYIQILGHTAAGRELLRLTRQNARLPWILRHADTRNLPEKEKNEYRLACREADLMALAMPKPQPCGLEERHRTIAL